MKASMKPLGWTILGNIVLFGVLLFLMAACADTLAGKVTQSCTVWASALKVAGDLKWAGKLSAGGIAAVDAVRPTANAICRDPMLARSADLSKLAAAIRSVNTVTRSPSPR